MTHSPSQNQALLALALEEGRERAGSCKVYLDEVRLQLLVYLLQRLGTPFAYIFDLRYAGPTCTALGNDLKVLTGARLLHHLPRTPGQWSEFVVRQPLDTPAWSRHGERVAAERERVRQNLAAFLPLDLDDLRLLASLDSVHKALRAAVPATKLESEVLATLAGVSRGRYARQRLVDAYRAYTASLLATA